MADDLSTKALAFFKNGIHVIPESDQMSLDLVAIESDIIDGVPMIRGWALPNKAFVFSLNDVVQRADSWVVTDKGTRYVFKPLDAKRAEQIEANLDGS